MFRRAHRTAAGSTSTACSSTSRTSASSTAPTAPEPQQRSTTTGVRPQSTERARVVPWRVSSSVRRRGTNTPGSTAIRWPQSSAQPTTCSSGRPDTRRRTIAASSSDVRAAETISVASSSANTQPATRRAATTSSGAAVGCWRGAGSGSSETGGLAVLAPLGAQRVADLAQGGLHTAGLEDRGDHVLLGAGHVHHSSEGSPDGGLVTVAAAARELTDLVHLDLVGDPEDLQIVGHRVGVAVHADDLLLALLQRGLVHERRLGDLRHEPALLDAAQDALGHRPSAVLCLG